MTRNDVLIIGAGPSGLFAASELACHGVGVRLIRAPRRIAHRRDDQDVREDCRTDQSRAGDGSAGR